MSHIIIEPQTQLSTFVAAELEPRRTAQPAISDNLHQMLPTKQNARDFSQLRHLLRRPKASINLDGVSGDRIAASEFAKLFSPAVG